MVSMIVSGIDGAQLFVHTLGRAVRVTGFVTSDDEANEYLEVHRGQGVIAQYGQLILMAENADLGKRVKP